MTTHAHRPRLVLLLAEERQAHHAGRSRRCDRMRVTGRSGGRAPAPRAVRSGTNSAATARSPWPPGRPCPPRRSTACTCQGTPSRSSAIQLRPRERDQHERCTPKTATQASRSPRQRAADGDHQPGAADAQRHHRAERQRLRGIEQPARRQRAGGQRRHAPGGSGARSRACACSAEHRQQHQAQHGGGDARRHAPAGGPRSRRRSIGSQPR